MLTYSKLLYVRRERYSVDPVSNPYSPGAGRRPVALVGRDAQTKAWQVALDRIQAGRTAQPLVLYGLRGVGKTVLLAEFARTARQRDWIVASVEAGVDKPLRELLGEALHGPLTDLVRPSVGRRVLKALKTAASFKTPYDSTGAWNFGLDLSESSGGGADTGILETDLSKLIKDCAEAATEDGVGLAILVDEAQDLSKPELTALCSIAHVAGQDGWSMTIGLAGLPSLPRELAEAKSYAERLFDYSNIRHLEPPLAEEALVAPAREEGIVWAGDAVAMVLQEAAGYPYFIQQYGQETWNEATGDSLELTDARVGVAIGRAALDAGFFKARWDRATKGEQQYLRTMALDGDLGSSSGEVAARLGKKANSFGPVRAKLIDKGLIYAPEHGVVAFTVPGMAAFISRQGEASTYTQALTGSPDAGGTRSQ